MKKFRLISQIVFFLIFILIFFRAIIDLNYYGESFDLKGGLKYIFIVDPLIAITTFIAAHKFELIFGISAIFLLLTLIFGRFFCGWICPFGSIHHFVSYVSAKFFKRKYEHKLTNLYKLKYYILIVLIFSAFFKLNFAGYFDPLSILVKGFGIFILPVISLIYKLELLPENIKDFLFYNILGRENFYYSQSVLIGSFFIFLIGLNIYKSRFWCVYLCPLGALYGFLAKYSFFKIKRLENCSNCKLCNEECYANAMPGGDLFKSSECMLLFDCLGKCSNNAISYKLKTTVTNIDLTRRETIFTLITATAGISIAKISNIPIGRNPNLIRPPGSKIEDEFLNLCIRCGGCMKVCPENFLQPAFLEAGLLGLWTPIGNANFGYCVFNCNLCGLVCPTGAIEKLSIDEKKKFVIGTAFIDKNRCLPYAYNTNCMVCEEHCPTSPKAIYFEEEILEDNNNKKILKKPKVNPRLCIGCGICQYKCPVTDKPAIYITSIKKGGLFF